MHIGHASLRTCLPSSWRVITGWLLATAIVLGLASSLGGALNDDYTIPRSDSQRASDLLAQGFPQLAGADARVVVYAEDGQVAASDLKTASAELAAMESVAAVSPAQLSADGATGLIGVFYDKPVTEFVGDEAVQDLESATEPLADHGYTVAFGGQVPENVQAPDGAAELVGVGAAAVILPLAFGSVVAAGQSVSSSG